MPQDVNPYVSPKPCEEQAGFLRRLFNWLKTACVRDRTFRKGFPYIYGGVAYFVDPEDSRTLYAGAPSEDTSDARLTLIAKEAIALLPEFLKEYEHLRASLDRRRLVVRIMKTYDGVYADYSRAVQVLPAPLRDSLESIKDDA